MPRIDLPQSRWETKIEVRGRKEAEERQNGPKRREREFQQAEVFSNRRFTIKAVSRVKPYCFI